MVSTKIIRKLLLIPIAISSVAVFCSVALASVIGSWDIEGMMKESVTVKGKSVTVNLYDTMLYVFNPDGTCSIGNTINIPCHWKENKTTFNVYISYADLQPFIDLLQNEVYTKYGLTIYFLPTSITLNGTENIKKNTIKGTLTLKATVYYVNYKKAGNMSVSYPFTGKREINSTALILREDDKSLKESASLLDSIAESIAATLVDDTENDLEQ